MDDETCKPSQQQLKTYLEERHHAGSPPPRPEEIRRRLGWGMVKSLTAITQKKVKSARSKTGNKNKKG